MTSQDYKTSEETRAFAVCTLLKVLYLLLLLFIICSLGFAQPVLTGSTLTVRNAHAMAYDTRQNLVYLFGGADEKSVLNDLWILKENRWQQLSLTEAPQARTFAAMVYDKLLGQMILFGGTRVLFGGDNKPDVILNDTWEFKDYQWCKLTTKESPGPEQRHPLCMILTEIEWCCLAVTR
jgi:hypothetical protein